LQISKWPPNPKWPPLFQQNCSLNTYLGHNYGYFYGIMKKSHTGVHGVNTMFPTPKFSLFQISKWLPKSKMATVFSIKTAL